MRPQEKRDSHLNEPRRCRTSTYRCTNACTPKRSTLSPLAVLVSPVWSPHTLSKSDWPKLMRSMHLVARHSTSPPRPFDPPQHSGVRKALRRHHPLLNAITRRLLHSSPTKSSLSCPSPEMTVAAGPRHMIWQYQGAARTVRTAHGPP